MKNSFWNRQVVLGSVVKLTGIVSVTGGIDPVANWESGYTASFSIDDYNTGFITIHMDSTPRIGTMGTIKDVTPLANRLLYMCIGNPPRIGNWDD